HSILALQGDVAQAIAREIHAKISPSEQTRLARPRPVNPAAHEAYFKGRFYLRKYSEEDELKGLEYLRKAVEEDQHFPLGHAALSTSYLWMALESLLPPKDTYAKAKAEAMKALELDDALSQAHGALADVKHY